MRLPRAYRAYGYRRPRLTRGRVAVLGACSVAAAALVPITGSAPAAAATSTTYGTPGVYTYTVPTGANEISFSVAGSAGAGATNGGVGGEGDVVTGNLAVNVGDTLTVDVGGYGTGFYSGGAGGSAFGGTPATAGGAGGGASDIRGVVIAGGGGGAGGAYTNECISSSCAVNHGGDAAFGSASGGAGPGGCGATNAGAGCGGAASGGGAGCAGVAGAGGCGGTDHYAGDVTGGGGGGGGGYYGGGGGASGGYQDAGGGGGGSSWYSSSVIQAGSACNGLGCNGAGNSATGRVTITATCITGTSSACVSDAEISAKAPCANGVTTDCATGVVPPVPVLDDGDPGSQFPTNQLTGSVMTGTSILVPGLRVKFYVEPANGVHDQTGTVLPVDYLGSAITDSQGAFNFQLPTLDSYAQSVANANNGLLNVLAAVATTATLPTNAAAPAITEYADADIPIQVGGSAQYFMSQPPVLTLEPATDTTAVDTSASGTIADNFDPTDPTLDSGMNYGGVSASTVTVNGAPVSAASYNPFVANGIDYRGALPVALTTGTSSATLASGPQDCSADPVYPLPVNGYPKVINSGSRNVIVGETHAYWDTTAGFEYGQNADSTIQAGFSTDATHWSVGGSVSVDNTHSAGGAEGFDGRGPYYGHQQRMTFWFTETQYKWYCYDNSGNKITWSRYRVAPTRCTWTFSEGKDVSKYDGFDGWGRSKTAYQNVVDRNGGYIIIIKGKAYHYSAAFNAFGASFGVVSGHSSYVQQKITAGNGQYEHDVWGNSGKPPATQIMYSW